MGLSTAEIDRLKAVVADYFPQTVQVLGLGVNAENELGELPAPTDLVQLRTTTGRLGRPNSRNPFTSGRPVGEMEMTLILPFGVNVTGLTAFGVDGLVYYPLGGAETTGAGYRTSVIYRVKRSDLLTPADVLVPVIPGAAQDLSTAPIDGGADLFWTEPLTGTPPTTYTARAYTVAAGGTPVVSVTVDGGEGIAILSPLTNGTTYYLTVVATNQAGTGPAAARVAVVPSAD